MKKILVFLLLAISSIQLLQAQVKKVRPNAQVGTYDTAAVFPGGGFAKYVTTHLKFQQKATANLHGLVKIDIGIDTTGNPSVVNVLKEVSPEITKEFKSVVASAPKWKPAMLNGKPVSVTFIYMYQIKTDSELNIEAKYIPIAYPGNMGHVEIKLIGDKH